MTQEGTLLEQAKALSRTRPPIRATTDEEVDLMIAYYRGLVTAKAVSKVLGFKSTGSTQAIYNWANTTLRAGLRSGRVRLTQVVTPGV